MDKQIKKTIVAIESTGWQKGKCNSAIFDEVTVDWFSEHVIVPADSA